MITTVKNMVRDFLLRIQGYTGTDNVYIAKQGFWASVPYIISTILSAALVVAFANLLPKEIYGTYRYILSIAGLLSFLTLTGMNTAITRAIAQGVRGLLAWSIHVQLRFNTLYAFAGMIGAGYYWLHGNTVLSGGLLIMAVTFPFSTALTSYGAHLAGKKDFRRAAHYAILSSIFFSALVLTALLFTDNIPLLVLAYTMGVLIPSAFFYFRTVKEDTGPIASIAQRNEALRYSTHLSVVPIIAVIAQYLDKILLFQSLGAVELAVYALAQAMPERMKGLAKSAGSILLPKLSERSLKEIRPIFYQRLALGMMLGLLCFGLYWFTAPFIFKIFLPSYLDSLSFSRVLMGSLILAIPFNYIGAVFRSQKMLRAIYLSGIIARTPTIILYFALGLTWGVWGMVWANIGGMAITVLGTIVIWEIEVRRLRI